MDTVVLARDTDFELADSALTTADGSNWLLVGIQRAELVGGTGDNQFVVSAWTGQGSLDGGAGNDEVVATKSGDMSLSDTSLTASDGMSLELAGIDRASLTGDSENNVIDAAGFLGDTTLLGLDGNDRLFGGSGNDVLDGGDGDDVIIGNAGSDQLTGGRDRDLLIGGADVDALDGGSGDDILIGGTTLYDSDRDALDAIMTEWSGDADYDARIERLMAGVGSEDQSRLDASTVFDDEAIDELLGGKDDDWFFNSPVPTRDDMPDRVLPKGKKPGERVTELS
jgi:Ca2+-binding RTX toxin-like protein